MQATAGSGNAAQVRGRLSPRDRDYCAAVVMVYLLAAFTAFHFHHGGLDRMMVLAQSVLAGHLDAPSLAGTVDTVTIDGRTYLAIGLLQLLPYLPGAALPPLQDGWGFFTGLLFGIPAALLALPLARAYGAQGNLAYWIAGFTAFGSLLLFVSVLGNFYYLAHAESFLALTLFLIEYAGKRRPALLGLFLGVSFLARPTTLFAAIPFGLALLWRRRESVASAARLAIAYAAPIAIALGIYFWFNWARFGSAGDNGYGRSLLLDPVLVQRRELGLFSIQHLGENLRLALLAGLARLDGFPWFLPESHGLSMLLVSPALLTALWAGFRSSRARLLWVACGIVAAPVFLYYGGGYAQYGFRYSLDFTPFLIALMAAGSSRWGRPERFLVVVSVASVMAGVVFGALAS